jgi:hypothetical protein
MSVRLNPLRWLMVVGVGCILGFVFIFSVLFFWPNDSTKRFPITRGNHGRFVSVLHLSGDRVKAELAQVVQSQLLAFRKDDFPKAYTYAGSRVHSEMPLPAFERMVRKGYPFIAQSRAVQFGVILDNGEEAVVNVGILDAAGRTHHYQYFLKLELTGWKINGVKEAKIEGIII